MFSFSSFLENGISPGILDKVWQSMFSFSLRRGNESQHLIYPIFSPGIFHPQTFQHTRFTHRLLAHRLFNQMFLTHRLFTHNFFTHRLFSHIFFSHRLFTHRLTQFSPHSSLFVNYSCEPWETPKFIFVLRFWPSQTLPTPLMGTMKHPNPLSCFILTLPKPFPPHSWEPRSTQLLFHASFWAFPGPSHPLVNHEAPNPLFMLRFWPSQTLPTPLIGTMKHPTTFSCFILRLPKPFPPQSCEPWETPKPFLMLHF